MGILLIPQGMAYALIAGLPPVYGLYASIVPQLIYAILGTSRQLSVAPVAMDSLLVAAGVSVLAVEGTEEYLGFAILLAFFMGLFQVLLGVMRMGFITNLLSKPVISGFTSGAAILIGLNQLKYLLGTDIEKSNKAYEVLWNAVLSLDQIHLMTFYIGVGGILIIKLAAKLNKSIPGSLIAVIFGILIVYFFSLHDDEVQIVKTIPQGLPSFAIPDFSLGKLIDLIPLAMTISVVAFMESYSVAKAIESKRKDHKVIANQELVGLGAANLVGSFFQSFPVTGGFSRTAVNEQAGAKTPIASVISAVLIALILLFFMPLFYFLPNTILASVIMVAIAGLIDLQYVKQLWKDSKAEFLLLIVTFLVTICFSMVPGIIAGVVFSILILLYRSAYPHIAILGRLKGQAEFRNIKRFKELELWNDKLIIRIDAPLSFINIQYLKDYLEGKLEENDQLKEVIIDASAISYLDATAIQGFSDLLDRLSKENIQLVLTELVGPVRDVLFRTGLLQRIGVENIYMSLNDALEMDSHDNYQNRDKALQHGLIADKKEQ